MSLHYMSHKIPTVKRLTLGHKTRVSSRFHRIVPHFPHGAVPLESLLNWRR